MTYPLAIVIAGVWMGTGIACTSIRLTGLGVILALAIAAWVTSVMV